MPPGEAPLKFIRRSSAPLALVVLGAVSCALPQTPPAARDRDGDGYTSDIDCDDNNASLYPGDNDGDGDTPCNGDCNDDDPTRNSLDHDGDGNSTCDGDCDDRNPDVEGIDWDTDGVSTCDGDCDDRTWLAYPGGERVCGDGIDNDCDGLGECGWLDTHDLALEAEPLILAAQQDGVYKLAFGHPHGPDAGLILSLSSYQQLVVDFPEGAATVPSAVATLPVVPHQGLVVRDINADGVDDVVATNGGALFGYAETFVFHGPILGDHGVGDAAAVIQGSPGISTWGSLSVLDLTGDGLLEIAIGEPSGYLDGSHVPGGVVHLVHGNPTGAIGAAELVNALIGTAMGDDLGQTGAAVPNFTGTGTEALLVTASGSEVTESPTTKGRVAIVESPIVGTQSLEDTPSFVDSSRSRFAERVVALRDLNGDGYGDAGTTGDGGLSGPTPGPVFQIRLIFGGPSAGLGGDLSSEPDWVLAPDTNSKVFGPAGDLNGDGFEDIYVEVEDYVVVTYGPFDGVVSAWDRGAWFAYPGFGSTALSIGDIDEDGFDDLVIAQLSVEVGQPLIFLVPGLATGF